MGIILAVVLILSQPHLPAGFIEDIATRHRRNHRFLIIVPVVDKNKSISICVNNTSLYEFVYKPNFVHTYPSFEKFLTLVLEKKILVQRKYIPDVLFLPINPQSKVLGFYKKYGFAATKKKYLRFSSGHLISRSGLSDTLDRNEVFNLYKIMFEHGYYSDFDDYVGIHIFFTPDQLNKL
jgi:hypothetical protein